MERTYWGTRRTALVVVLAALLAAGPAEEAGALHPAPDQPAISDGVLLPPPTTEPTISGAELEGSELTGTLGLWLLPSQLSSEWLRCDSTGSGCVHTHAEGLSYLLLPEDVGRRLKLRVRAEMGFGGAREVDAVSGVIDAVPPSPSRAPSVNGDAREGQLLDGDGGQWTGTPPLAFAYQWLRCTAGCVEIAGATLDDYRPTAADIGAVLKLRVIATGPRRATIAESAPSAIVMARASLLPPARAVPPSRVVIARPANTGRPTIDGTATQRGRLTARPGSWGGAQPISFSYAWLRCRAICLPTGASGPSYRLRARDVGARMRVTVRAANAGGSQTASSTPTPIVAGLPGGESPRPLAPFPIVSISGRVLGAVTLVSHLGVSNAPEGSTIDVRCFGRACPQRRLRRRVSSASVRIRTFERGLRAGTVLAIRVRKGRALGKYARFRFRRGEPPVRSDGCLGPGARRPSSCPRG